MKSIILIALCCFLSVQAAPESRIYNGHDVPVGENVPWHAHLVCTGNLAVGGQVWIGSGAYIGGVFVLTTARNTINIASMSVQMGHRERASLTPLIGLTFMPHVGFEPATLVNNIGLITLSAVPPTLGGLIAPIALPIAGEVGIPVATQAVSITGFGFTNSAGTVVANILQRANKVVLTDAACQVAFPHLATHLATNFCAVDAVNNANICGGDEGSAVAIFRLGNAILTGLSNFRWTGPCNNGQPSAYVRIHSYLPWIFQFTGIQ